MKGFALRRLFLLAWIAAMPGLWSCSPGGGAGKVESINFGTVPTAASTLIYIAQDQQFFVDVREVLHKCA